MADSIREKKRILIAEDHTILREGLRALLSSHADLEIVAEAEDGQATIRGVEKFKPDLVSFKTVEKHRSNLMKKLDLHSIQALTTLALEKGLVTRD
jgi:DNA-binding NarL/FixJ family response regulator